MYCRIHCGKSEGKRIDGILRGVLRYQDPESKLFYQLIDLPDEPGNYLETSGTAMIAYSILKACRLGVLLSEKYRHIGEEILAELLRQKLVTIDGCSKPRQFLNITIPMITPVIFFNFITQLCQAFQEFNGPFIITNGGPRGSTTLISILIYQNAFKTYKMGLASAMAWLLFIIVATLTAISFISQKYWVYYGDE